jgi:hypothetical protein
MKFNAQGGLNLKRVNNLSSCRPLLSWIPKLAIKEMIEIVN